jgi:hypothetical protein
MATTGINAIISDAEHGEDQHQNPGAGRIADSPAHRLPAGMTDVNGVDERVAEQAADEADDAVRR